MITRRALAVSTPWLAPGPLTLCSCIQTPAADGNEALAGTTWRLGSTAGLDGHSISLEMVRYAMLAPSSYNTVCWRFTLAASGQSITVQPDLARRCPAVNPDNHHVFVSLGCAKENLIQAALVDGLNGQAQFDGVTDAVYVRLEPIRAQTTALFKTIAIRQSTRGDFEGTPLSGEELAPLQRAGSSDKVPMLLLTERLVIEQVLDYVIQCNTAQYAEPAFVKEMKAWIRFNAADAIPMRDELYSVSSGDPNITTWIGEMAFRMILTPKGDNDKYARQVRSSAGIAALVGQAADKANWVEKGRCYERLALQATALGICNALLNRPVEVAALRPPLAAAPGLTRKRPDLVVRLGRGLSLPHSLRRPVEAVLV